MDEQAKNAFRAFGFDVEAMNTRVVYLTESEAAEGCEKPANIGASKPCGACGRKGKRGLLRCKACDGMGWTHLDVNILLHIPKGTRTGDKIRYTVCNPEEGALLSDYTVVAEIGQMPVPFFPDKTAPNWFERITITEEEAKTGCRKTIHYKLPVLCEPCGGRGYQHREQRCEACGGLGCVQGSEDTSYELTIPAGMRTGTCFRIKKQGAYKKNGRRGNLIIVMEY